MTQLVRLQDAMRDGGSTLAELQQIPIPVSPRAVFVIDGDRSGNAVFDTSDLSVEVAADPSQDLYIAPDSDLTGASGAWVRVIGEGGRGALGSFLNAGGDTSDLSLWYQGSPLSDPPVTLDNQTNWDSVSIIDNNTGPFDGATYIRFQDADTANEQFWSEAMPYDPNKNYRIGTWVRQDASPGQVHFLGLRAYDENGNNIQATTSTDTWTNGSGGYASKGSYYYYGVVSAEFPQEWTYYEYFFGPDYNRQISSETQRVAIGGLISRTDTASTQADICRMRIEEVIVDPRVAGIGPTVDRPLSPVRFAGASYFDSTLGKPIWYDGTNWVDATGTIV